MSNSTSNEIQSLQDSITYMWDPTKSVLESRQADDALLKTFFTSWEDLMKTGETNVQGYKDAVAQVGKGSPGVPNSGITESQLLEKIKKALGKPLDPIDQFDIKKIETDINGLKGNIRKTVALGFFCDSQIQSLNDEIDQLNQQTGDPLYGESPDAGNDDSEF